MDFILNRMELLPTDINLILIDLINFFQIFIGFNIFNIHLFSFSYRNFFGNYQAMI